MVSAPRARDFAMSTFPREFFTVDLRGLRAALAARATKDGATEADVFRSALVAAPGNGTISAAPSQVWREAASCAARQAVRPRAS